MNRNVGWNPAAAWRRQTLWPRLAIGVTVGFLILFAGFSVLGIRAVDASTNRILHERLAITEELADDFDGLLQHRFADLTAFDSRPAPPSVQRRLLAEIYYASGGAFTSLSLLDSSGTIAASLGPSARAQLPKPYVIRIVASGRRAISRPFRDSRGRPVVALGVPIHVHNSVRDVLVGTLDLTGPDVVGRLDAARRLGRTGHAELVGPDGVALASTEAGSALVPGEHLSFYREMLKAAQPGIANVPVTLNGHEPPDLQHERHTMAFVRLSRAPWAVALGGTESETYAPARHLRHTLILAGGGSLAVLWLLTLLGARLLVRPVRDLTRAAERMASGNLDETVSVSEGGEIGVLAGSLETMRAQLKDSLETVRRWGEELELKVADRTAELNARNRQLGAVSAILTAANEARELEGMLQRCLEVVLEQTVMEDASVRLLDDGRGHSTETSARGTSGDFPCRRCIEGFWDVATRDGQARFLDPSERERLHPDCADVGEALAMLPLRGPSGVLGVLILRSREGRLPSPEERSILTAICDQIAVAIENTRLAAELRQLEARQEVQRMRSELISAVSHELRTPLGFIKSYATTLLREDTPIELEMRRHFLEIIDEETDKLEHMIDELLDASRLQAGRLPIEPKPVGLGGLVSHAAERARPKLEESGHTLSVRLPDEDVAVLADSFRIDQVLDNLLENAGRYSLPSSSVDVSLVTEAEHALVRVSNRGDNIATAELEQIFEPFYRGRNATQRGVRGAGLGLAICRGIIEAHGGTIWAETGKDHDVSFFLTLPLAESGAAHAASPQTARTAR